MNKLQASNFLSVTLVGSSSAGIVCLWLLDASIKSLLLLSLGAAVCFLLSRASAATRHWIWATLLIGLIIMPAATLVLPKWRILPSWLSIENQLLDAPRMGEPPTSWSTSIAIDSEIPLSPLDNIEVTSPVTTELTTAVPIVNSAPASVWPLAIRLSSNLLLTIWAVGALLMLAPVAFAFIRLKRLERASSKQEMLEPHVLKRVASISNELDVKQPRIIIGTTGAMPMVWSFGSGRLLLPKDCDEWTTTRLNAVLSHELIHLRRRDPMLFSLGLLACAMNWFNPLAWYAVRRLRIECERACDDHVLRLGIDASEYAGHLLAFSAATRPARGTSSLAFAMSTKPNIEQRIVSVLDEKLNSHGVTFRRAFVLLLIVASGVALLATLRATVANESPHQVDDEKVEIKYPHCVIEVDNLQPRSLAEAIKAFNLEAKQSPTGVGQRPISEPEILAAIAKSLEQPEVADSVKAVLREIVETKMLPSKAYFRRFTRFDDEQQMHGVWWVCLCIEGEAPMMYSVPIRTTNLFSRPYSQLERQQNSEKGVSLINRSSSYFEEPPLIKPAEELPQAAVGKLIASVKTGLEDKSINELKSLFDWQGASLSEFAVSELQMLLKATVHTIKVEPVRLKGNLLHWAGFGKYHSNLPVVAYLEIEYTLPDDPEANTKSISIELGESDEELRLVNYVAEEPILPAGIAGVSMRGHTEQLADGIYQLTSLISNPGELLSAHLANEEVRHRDYEHKRTKRSVINAQPGTIKRIEFILKSLEKKQTEQINEWITSKRIRLVTSDVKKLVKTLTEFYGGKAGGRVETFGLDDLQPNEQQFADAMEVAGRPGISGPKIAFVADCLTDTLWIFALPEDIAKIEARSKRTDAYRDFDADELLAVVGTESVFAGELMVFIEPILGKIRDKMTRAQEALLKAKLIRDVLAQYVEIKAHYQEFFRDMLGNKTPKEVEEMKAKVIMKAAQIFHDKQIPVMMKKYQVDDLSALESKLQQKSISIHTLKKQFTERVLSSELERKYVPEDFEFSREELLKYYQDHGALWEEESGQKRSFESVEREVRAKLSEEKRAPLLAAFRAKIAAQTKDWTVWPEDILNSRPLAERPEAAQADESKSKETQSQIPIRNQVGELQIESITSPDAHWSPYAQKQNAVGQSLKILDKIKEMERPAVQILWGESVDGIQLGIRPTASTKRSTRFHHGDWLRYEVWIKNASTETIHVPRDTRDALSPAVAEKCIDLLGASMFLSFHIPVEELDKATTSLKPGESALLVSPQTPIYPTEAVQGRFGPQALRVAPGRYPLYAKIGLYMLSGGVYDRTRTDGKQRELQSGSIDIEVLPAAKLQIRNVNEFTERRTREFVAKDPASHVLELRMRNGKKEVVLDDASEVLLDESDLWSAVAMADVNNAPFYKINLTLKPESVGWFFKQTKQLCDSPRDMQLDTPLLGIFFAGKLISAPKLTTPIGQQATITGQFTKEKAEEIAKELRPSTPVFSFRPVPTRIGESRLLRAEDVWRDDFLESGIWQPSVEKESIVQLRRRDWKLRFVEASTGNPVPGVKIRVHSLATGRQLAQPVKATSDAEGIATVKVVEGAPARVEVVSTEWWQVGQTLLDADLMAKTAEDAGEKNEIIDIKLNRGQPIDLPTERDLRR